MFGKHYRLHCIVNLIPHITLPESSNLLVRCNWVTCQLWQVAAQFKDSGVRLYHCTCRFPQRHSHEYTLNNVPNQAAYSVPAPSGPDKVYAWWLDNRHAQKMLPTVGCRQCSVPHTKRTTQLQCWQPYSLLQSHGVITRLRSGWFLTKLF